MSELLYKKAFKLHFPGSLLCTRMFKGIFSEIYTKKKSGIFLNIYPHKLNAKVLCIYSKHIHKAIQKRNRNTVIVFYKKKGL